MVFRHDSKKVSIDRTQFLQFSIRLMANIRIVTKKEALKRLLVLAINDEISFQPESSLLEFRLLAISNGKIGSGGLRGLEGFGFLWKVFE